jgi:hypothetical protein
MSDLIFKILITLFCVGAISFITYRLGWVTGYEKGYKQGEYDQYMGMGE